MRALRTIIQLGKVEKLCYISTKLMDRDKKQVMIDLVAADVVSAIMEDTAFSVQEAMKAFYNSDVFDRLCDTETGLYRESGGYVYDLYKNWHISESAISMGETK